MGRKAARRGRRRRVPAFLPVLLVAVGLAIAAAPLLMDIAYRVAAHRDVESVESTWTAADDAEAERVWAQARAYNRVLAGRPAGKDVKKVLPYAEQLVYNAWPCMCYVRVPGAGIELPVYHGTGDAELSAGAGHLEGTSLPVGGRGSNCCISAHSGIQTAAMFDDLRYVSEGDYVELRTLGRSLWYRVSEVAVVMPSDTGPLKIAPGHDRLTLITCTSEPNALQPRGGFGVNDRRLVVVCERSAAPPEEQQMAPVASFRNLLPLAAVAGVLAAVAAGALRRGRKRRLARRYGPWPEGSRELAATRRATARALERERGRWLRQKGW